jgi:hypothetical protein
MSKLSPDQWRALSPHLDEALEMTDEERSTWLSSLQSENPTLAHQLPLTRKACLSQRSHRVAQSCYMFRSAERRTYLASAPVNPRLGFPSPDGSYLAILSSNSNPTSG